MGVTSCSRKYCDNVMCDTYVEDIGYICYECKSEFKEFSESQDVKPKTQTEIKKNLHAFMSTTKGDSKDVSIDDFFSIHRIKKEK